MSGIVRETEVRTNAWSRASFVWASVDTLGATFEVVAPISGPPIAEGNVVRGRFWLVGARA